jgi:PleD family two-component response regulator
VGLDRILNRDFFLHVLDLEVKRARRYQNFLSILILEMNTLPNENGEQDLQTSYQMLTMLLMEEMRESDIFGSLGGNRLAILLPYADALAGGYAKSRFEDILKYYDFKSRGYEVVIHQISFPMDGTNTSDLMRKVLETRPS